MAVATFDTLKFANALKAAGVPEKQAEAEATVLAEALQVNLKDLATKEDVKAVETATLAEVKSVRAEVKAAKDELKAAIAHLRDLFKWMCGILVGLILPILIRLFLWRGAIN